MATGIVVGSGPNGLAAAVRLAQSGVDVTVLEAADEIGGGTRSAELTGDGLVHDVCSAVHPFALASPYFSSLDLEAAGLSWAWPEIDLAHPLDDGTAGTMFRSLDATAASLGPDGAAWRAAFGPLAGRLDALTADTLQPLVRVPDHPVSLLRFGLGAAQPATLFARRFSTAAGRALWAGSAAHVFHPLSRPMTSSVGLMLVASSHAVGWPVAVGGSRAIADALARLVTDAGGRIETSTPVTDFGQVADADVVMFDLSPAAVSAIVGDRLPARVRRAYRRWRNGPAAFKVDFAVDGGIPWTNEDCRRAGTVHVGGTIEEIADAEAATWKGRMPDRPFMLVGQQYLADPSRSVGDLHPVWAYAHVPNGYAGDATDTVIAQIERFAPGFRDRIVATSVRSTSQIEAHNANFVGGDISTGANDPWQLVARPRLSASPYATGVPGVYICSAATPPGAGVHGMCGANAARSALRYLDG